MKYYDEDRMRNVRRALESMVLKWPGVASREMMGCLCYFRGRKFFAFLVTDGVVITKLSEGDRSKVSERLESKPFQMAGRTAASWIQVRLSKPEDVEPVLPFIRTSYEVASRR